MEKMQQARKIDVKRISIQRAEGPTERCLAPRVACSWSEATGILAQEGVTAPASGGYDKCDFTVVFHDGEQYSGRYDLKHPSVEVPDLFGHVRAHVGAVSGLVRPPHMSQQSYDGLLEHYRREGLQDQMRDFARRYEVGVAVPDAQTDED